MKVLVRANSEFRPFSKDNGYFNVILEDNIVSIGTTHFNTLWDSRLIKSPKTIDKVDHSRTFLIVDLPDTPITIEEFLDQYPELLL
jgi:hypothetical protein